MGNRMLLVLFATALAANAGATGIGRQPPAQGPMPEIIVVARLQPDGQVFYQKTTMFTMQAFTARTEVQADGQFSQFWQIDTCVGTKTEMARLDLREGEVFSARGRMLGGWEISQRVREGTIILKSANGKHVDPIHVKGAGRDTLILVPKTTLILVPKTRP